MQYLITVSVSLNSLPSGWDDSAMEADCFSWVQDRHPDELAVGGNVPLWAYNKIRDAGHMFDPVAQPEYAFVNLDIIVDAHLALTGWVHQL